MQFSIHPDEPRFSRIVYDEIARLRQLGNTVGFIQRRLDALGVRYYGIDTVKASIWGEQVQRLLYPKPVKPQPKATKRRVGMPAPPQLFDDTPKYTYNRWAVGGPNAAFQ